MFFVDVCCGWALVDGLGEGCFVMGDVFGVGSFLFV